MLYVISGIAIVICGSVGAIAAWKLVSALGWTGVGAAVAMTFIAMVIATALWAIGVVLGRALRLLK